MHFGVVSLSHQQGVVGEIPALHDVPCTNSHDYGAVDKVNSHAP